MRNSRLISEKLWEEKEFVEIGQMVYQQIPSNHPIYDRLIEFSSPLREHFCEGIQLGQTWEFVRTDLSASALYDLTDGVSEVFYNKILNSYAKGKPPTEETLMLHDMLGRTLRLILQPSFVAVLVIADEDDLLLLLILTLLAAVEEAAEVICVLQQHCSFTTRSH